MRSIFLILGIAVLSLTFMTLLYVTVSFAESADIVIISGAPLKEVNGNYHHDGFQNNLSSYSNGQYEIYNTRTFCRIWRIRDIHNKKIVAETGCNMEYEPWLVGSWSWIEGGKEVNIDSFEIKLRPPIIAQSTRTIKGTKLDVHIKLEKKTTYSRDYGTYSIIDAMIEFESYNPLIIFGIYKAYMIDENNREWRLKSRKQISESSNGAVYKLQFVSDYRGGKYFTMYLQNSQFGRPWPIESLKVPDSQ